MPTRRPGTSRPTRASTRAAVTPTSSNGTGARVLTIRQADPAGMTLTPIKGQTSPVEQGWYSSTYAFKQPAWALEFTRTAPNALFTTLLAAGPYASQTSTVRDEPGDRRRAREHLRRRHHRLHRLHPDRPERGDDGHPGACAAPPAPGAGRRVAPAAARHRRSTLSAADQAAFQPLPARAGAIPVLLFHSVCATTGCTSYNATPTEFARIMLMLQAAGYHTISLDDYAKWWHGQAVTLPDEADPDHVRRRALGRLARRRLDPGGARRPGDDVRRDAAGRTAARRSSCAGTSSSRCRRRAAGTSSSTPARAT